MQCHALRFHGGALGSYKDYVIHCRDGTRVAGPDDEEFPLRPLACVHVRAGITEARVLTSPMAFETHLLVPDVKIKNLATGEESSFGRQGLPLGVNTEFCAGAFYEQPTISAFYYCHSIAGGIATIFLVESFQIGNLIQAKFTAKAENAKFYIPVSEKAVIRRLQRRLNRLKGTIR